MPEFVIHLIKPDCEDFCAYVQIVIVINHFVKTIKIWAGVLIPMLNDAVNSNNSNNKKCTVCWDVLEFRTW